MHNIHIWEEWKPLNHCQHTDLITLSSALVENKTFETKLIFVFFYSFVFRIFCGKKTCRLWISRSWYCILKCLVLFFVLIIKICYAHKLHPSLNILNNLLWYYVLSYFQHFVGKWQQSFNFTMKLSLDTLVFKCKQ